MQWPKKGQIHKPKMIYKTLHIINEHLRFKQNTNKQTKQKKRQYISCCLVLGGSHSAIPLVVV